MKNNNRFILLLAVLTGMIFFKFNLFEINIYKKEIISVLLIYLVVDYIIRTSLKFKKFIFLKTKYDILYRIANLTIGVIATGILIWSKSHFFEFGWMVFIVSFLGVFNGIVYQYSIQLSKKGNGLIVIYKQRHLKVIENPDLVIFRNGVLVIHNDINRVEVNDLKDSFWNRRRLDKFFQFNFPHLVVE